MESSSSVSPRRCTFADLPSELIVRIAGWLPRKDLRRLKAGDVTPQPRRRISADLANLSVVNQRVRAVLAERVIFKRLDLTRTTYDGLKEILEHRDWLVNVVTNKLQVAVAAALNLYPGRTVYEYDALMADVIAKACKLNHIVLNLSSIGAETRFLAACRVYLTRTLRTISQSNRIDSINLDCARSTADYTYILGLLQSWPNAEKVRCLPVSDTQQAQGSKLHIFVHLWQTAASFPQLRDLYSCIDLLLPSGRFLDGSLLVLPSISTLRYLRLEAMYDTRDACVDAGTVLAQVLQACLQIETFSVDALDFLWLHQDSPARYEVHLPRLRALELRCNTRPDVLLDDHDIELLTRPNSILSASPIRELEIDSLGAARFVCRLMRFDHAALRHLRQLVLHQDISVQLRHLETDVPGTTAEALVAQCTQRGLSILVTHISNYDGMADTMCACCS